MASVVVRGSWPGWPRPASCGLLFAGLPMRPGRCIGRRRAGHAHRRPDPGPRHAERDRGVPRVVVRAVEPAVRDAHRQGRRRLRHRARPGRELGGERRRADVHVHASRRPRSGATASRSPPTTSPSRSTPPAIRSGSTTSSTTAEPRRHRDRRAHGGDHQLGAGSEAADRWTCTSCPKHIWESRSPRATSPPTTALDGVGSGPFTLTGVEAGQSWTMKANPNYWQGRAGDRPGRLPGVHQRRRHGGGAASRARSTPPTRCRRRAFESLRRGRRHRGRLRRAGRFHRTRHERQAGGHRRRPPGAARHRGAPRDRTARSTSRRCSTG